MAGHPVVILLDSGASTEFISSAFVKKASLDLEPSNRTIRLADGSVVPADGQVRMHTEMTAAVGGPLEFDATFVATTLEGYDAILGATWLKRFNPPIDWRDRSFTMSDGKGGSMQAKALPIPQEKGHRLAGITTRKCLKWLRDGEVDGFVAVFVRKVADSEEELMAISGDEAIKKATNGAKPWVHEMVKEYGDVFPDKLPDGIPPSRGVEHKIDLVEGARPPPVRPLRHSSGKDLGVIEKYVREEVEAGRIQPSNSPFGAMALVVLKKDGEPRVVVDYRGLNEITVKDRYPLPLMDELFDRVHDAKFFTKIDLRTGFHQIRIAEGDTEKTAFRTRYGSYEYRVLPMGLCNAPSTFMKLMNDTFRDMLDKWVLVFLDDILIFSRTEQEHEEHLRQVLGRLRKERLCAKLSKCEFARREVEFLGHRIGADGLSTSPDKVKAVADWPTPRSVAEVRSFLGLAGFYRKYVKDFSKIALPITELTKGSVAFRWDKDQQAAFAELKKRLCEAPVLVIPDPKLPMVLNTDACDYAVGGTLQQDKGNGLQPVAYWSRKLSPAERNYDVREKEFLALKEACQFWRPYLHSGVPFKLLTDHDSLKYHKSMPNLSGRLARWVEAMSEFDYTIEHIPGKKNVVADAISRRADLQMDAVDSSETDESKEEEELEAARVAKIRKIMEERQAAKKAAEQVLPPDPNRPAPDKNGSIRMPSQRCTADTKKGVQCGQRTAKGQYCWNHLRTVSGIRIKKSSAPGAGFGLFAARDLSKGHRIAYTGDRIQLLSDQVGGPYFLEVRAGEAVDAARTNSGEGRWINDPKGTTDRANCRFVLHTPTAGERTACVELTRNVSKDEELWVNYGAAYWRYHGTGNGKKTRPKVRPSARLGIRKSVRLMAISEWSSEELVGDILQRIKAAAEKDEAYQAQLKDVPLGRSAKDGLLWKEDGRIQIPNDAKLRTLLLSECHDAVSGTHMGRDKLVEVLKRRFVWQGLASDAAEYVATCVHCQRSKPSQQSTPGLLMPLAIPEKVGDEWSTDTITGLPKTKRGHTAIQVYVERLTKLKRFAATHKTDDAPTMARDFVDVVVSKHGVPRAVVSDRDPRFTASFFKEVTRLMGSRLHMSTARHPQSDGQTERENRSLIEALRSYCNHHQSDWDDYLPMLEFGFNDRVQASTGMSPNFLMYGQELNSPLDVALGVYASSNPAAVDRAKRMRDAIKFAKANLREAQGRQAKNADRRRRQDEFRVDDQVLLSTEGLNLQGFDNKLCSLFIGPFRVIEIINPNAYKLDLPSAMGALHPTFNIEKLKHFRPSNPDRFPDRPTPHTRPPPVAKADSNGDTEFEVERILAKRKKGRSFEYLVKWTGYPMEESQWMPQKELSQAKGAIEEFHRNQFELSQCALSDVVQGIIAMPEPVVPPAPRLVGVEPNPGPCQCEGLKCKNASECPCQVEGKPCSKKCDCRKAGRHCGRTVQMAKKSAGQRLPPPPPPRVYDSCHCCQGTVTDGCADRKCRCHKKGRECGGACGCRKPGKTCASPFRQPTPVNRANNGPAADAAASQWPRAPVPIATQPTRQAVSLIEPRLEVSPDVLTSQDRRFVNAFTRLNSDRRAALARSVELSSAVPAVAVLKEEGRDGRCLVSVHRMDMVMTKTTAAKLNTAASGLVLATHELNTAAERYVLAHTLAEDAKMDALEEDAANTGIMDASPNKRRAMELAFGTMDTDLALGPLLAAVGQDRIARRAFDRVNEVVHGERVEVDHLVSVGEGRAPLPSSSRAPVPASSYPSSTYPPSSSSSRPIPASSPSRPTTRSYQAPNHEPLTIGMATNRVRTRSDRSIPEEPVEKKAKLLSPTVVYESSSPLAPAPATPTPPHPASPAPTPPQDMELENIVYD